MSAVVIVNGTTRIHRSSSTGRARLLLSLLPPHQTQFDIDDGVGPVQWLRRTAPMVGGRSGHGVQKDSFAFFFTVISITVIAQGTHLLHAQFQVDDGG